MDLSQQFPELSKNEAQTIYLVWLRNEKSFVPIMTSDDKEKSWIKPIRQMSPLRTNQNGMLALFK